MCQSERYCFHLHDFLCVLVYDAGFMSLQLPWGSDQTVGKRVAHAFCMPHGSKHLKFCSSNTIILDQGFVDNIEDNCRRHTIVSVSTQRSSYSYLVLAHSPHLYTLLRLHRRTCKLLHLYNSVSQSEFGNWSLDSLLYAKLFFASGEKSVLRAT
jgi:hypothetical protein